MAYAWKVVALLWVVACLNYLDRQVIFSVFPLLKAEINVNDLELGLLSTVFLWVYGLASPLGGWLADRLGQRRILVVSLFIWTSVTFLTGYAHGLPALLAARALMGLSEACYLPAALSLIAALHGERTRSLATGLHQTGLYAGLALGGFAGGRLAEQHGWRMPFLVLGGIGLAYVLVLQYNLPRDTNSSAPRTQSVPFFPAAVEVLRLPAYQEMLVGFTATSIANWVIYTWLPLFVYERFSVGLASAGFSATFYLQVASFGGVLAGGWLADRWNRLATQAVGLLLAAPFLLLAASAGSLNLLIVALIAFGIGKGFYDANTMPVLAQVARPELRATGYGLFNLVGCVVGGTMAAVAGALKPIIGIAGAVQISGILLFAASFALLSAKRKLVRL